MGNNIGNTRMIAKNAIFLYIRMFVMLLITLFTSREVLRILGIEDFGIYNVVGGIVVLFHFFQSSLVNSTQRYLSYELGRGTEESVQKIFGTSLSIHILFGIIILLLGETIGLWFLNFQLNIPEMRLHVANIVYQFTLFTFVVNILRTPYNSSIIAYERMPFYAYISIMEAGMKLGVVYVLVLSDIDSLPLYAILLFVVSVLMYITYWIYCRYNFSTCIFRLFWNKETFKEMLSYSGWAMLGSISNVTAQQGCNILLNIYSGLVANASFGIANQVSQAVYAFSSNLQTAFNPQITKLYSIGNYKALYKLVFRSSVISYYLMLLIAIPIVYKIHFFLDLWLVETPYYAAHFCVIMVLYQLVDAFQFSLNTLIHATGKIRNYYIWLSSFIFLCLPLSWGLLLLGCNPVWVILLRLLINVLTGIVRVLYMHKVILFPLFEYLKDVVLKVVITTVVSFMLAYSLDMVLPDSFMGTVFFTLFAILSTGLTSLYLGLEVNDRAIVLDFVKKRIDGK